MKKKKYLPLYYEWAKSGILPNHGVCECIGENLGFTERSKFENLFKPSPEFDGLWGYDGKNYLGWLLPTTKYMDIAYSFNDLRQNMILLMAAMNNEL